MSYVDEIAASIRSQLDSSAFPEEPVDDLLNIYAVLALALGDAVTRADVHDAWVAWMLRRDPAHPSLVPYTELDTSTAQEDQVFVDAIRTVARERHLGRHRLTQSRS